MKPFLKEGRGHLNGRNYKVWLLATILILVLCEGVPWVVTRAALAAQGTALSDAKRDKILTYIRERFGVPDNVKLSLGPLHASAVAPDFNEGTVRVDDGKKQRAQPVLVSKDSRFLIVVPPSGIIELHQNSAAEMAQRIQEAFKIPAKVKISVGGFKPSPSPDFEQGTLTCDDGTKPKQDVPVLLGAGWQTPDRE